MQVTRVALTPSTSERLAGSIMLRNGGEDYSPRPLAIYGGS